MANSTKRDIVQKLRREERLAIRATHFMQKPTTVRQTKRTISIAVFGSVLLIVLAVLRFTILDPAFEPSPVDVAPVKKAITVSSATPKPLSIEELEKQAIINNPRNDKSSH